MSCGLHDVVALEAAGIPTTIVGTEVFRDEATEQALALGMPEQRLVELPHPIQPIPLEQVLTYADRVFDEVVARLTGR